MNNLHATTTHPDSTQGAVDARHITLETLTRDIEAVYGAIVHLLENIPSPSAVPGHAEREEKVDRILSDMASTFIRLTMHLGIEQQAVTAFTRALKPHVRTFVVTVGDVNERSPYLFPALATLIVTLLIPEASILRLVGFGPAGPIKGSAATWMQRTFFGAAVRKGSWFAGMQAAGMGKVPFWVTLVTKGPLAVGGLLATALSPYLRRRT